MLNNTTLVGRLSREPELRYTGSGVAVTSTALAVERNYKNAQGERETDFINIVAWRGTAETLANFAVKGSLIGVTGSIQTRNYQNNEGRTIYITEVVIDNFQMLEPKQVTDERRNQSGQPQQSYNNQNQQQNNQYNNRNNQNTNNQQNPFANVDFGNKDPFDNNNVKIDESDLPF